jgi:hypothetical protein
VCKVIAARCQPIRQPMYAGLPLKGLLPIAQAPTGQNIRFFQHLSKLPIAYTPADRHQQQAIGQRVNSQAVGLSRSRAGQAMGVAPVCDRVGFGLQELSAMAYKFCRHKLTGLWLRLAGGFPGASCLIRCGGLVSGFIRFKCLRLLIGQCVPMPRTNANLSSFNVNICQHAGVL